MPKKGWKPEKGWKPFPAPRELVVAEDCAGLGPLVPSCKWLGPRCVWLSGCEACRLQSFFILRERERQSFEGALEGGS